MVAVVAGWCLLLWVWDGSVPCGVRCWAAGFGGARGGSISIGAVWCCWLLGAGGREADGRRKRETQHEKILNKKSPKYWRERWPASSWRPRELRTDQLKMLVLLAAFLDVLYCFCQVVVCHLQPPNSLSSMANANGQSHAVNQYTNVSSRSDDE